MQNGYRMRSQGQVEVLWVAGRGDVKDGFILFYVKDNNLLPVRINDEQTKTLQDFIPVIFQEEKIYVIDNPIGKVIDKEIKENQNANKNDTNL